MYFPLISSVCLPICTLCYGIVQTKCLCVPHMQTTPFSLFKGDNPREIVLLPCSDGFCILSEYSWNTAQPEDFISMAQSVDSLKHHNISFVYQWPCRSGLFNQYSIMQNPPSLRCKHMKYSFEFCVFPSPKLFLKRISAPSHNDRYDDIYWNYENDDQINKVIVSGPS